MMVLNECQIKNRADMENTEDDLRETAVGWCPCRGLDSDLAETAEC